MPRHHQDCLVRTLGHIEGSGIPSLTMLNQSDRNGPLVRNAVHSSGTHLLRKICQGALNVLLGVFFVFGSFLTIVFQYEDIEATMELLSPKIDPATLPNCVAFQVTHTTFNDFESMFCTKGYP